MPSSVIIVALAAAWLVVLVPMVARRRQQVARTADSALAARVVRSGGGRNEDREEFAMSDNPVKSNPVKSRPSVEDDLAELEAELELDDDLDEEEPEPLPQPGRAERRAERERERAGYRPGRGGFDPEAAEMAARAKYGFRQRVVVILLVVAVITAGVAGFLFPLVWWGHAVADVVLVGYLVYLRRQVRIEEEIRQRRLARFNSTRAPRRPSEPGPRQSVSASVDHDVEPDDEADDVAVVEVVEPARREIVERRPSPTSRIRRSAVVVDLDDEDPAFEELDEPGTGPYRRAVGE
ncbi:gephyrin-like molybdotransferase receptor GlpR [Amycolatopsis sp. cmx-8-4]|uniref:divisome protein SepX/GlpR n=1 Tax=Amycolatopsis sp. cmx-8-4 TaxID=2790947 RepID=UPI00397E1B41